MKTSKKPRVLVVGAGIGGLTAGLALLRKGFDVSIYERVARLSEVGAGFHCSPNGSRVLVALGLGEELARVGVRPHGREIKLWNTGQKWQLQDHGKDSAARYGAPYFLLHRGDLHSILVSAVRAAKPDCIHPASPCVGFEQSAGGVRLSLADGTSVSGDVLVGADGIHSTIRKQLFGADNPRFTGTVAWRGLVPIGELSQSISRDASVNWIGPRGSVTHYPVRRGELLNFAGPVRRTNWAPESWIQEGSREEALNDFAGWHPDVLEIIRKIPTLYIWGLFLRDPLTTWTEGRATLLGDACHPMLPFLGQGANMALEDAMVLARCLERYCDDPEAGLRVYEATRQHRACLVVQKSHEQSDRIHDSALGDPATAEKYASANWTIEKIRDRYDWIFSYDATSVPLDAESVSSV